MVLGDYIRGDGCVIAVLRGPRSMKKVIVKASIAMKQRELNELTTRLKKQWDEGFMVIPNCFDVHLVDDWINCDKALPKEGEMVLIWYEYNEDSKVYQNYGFGWIKGNEWLVCYATNVSRVIAWSSLPAPYEEKND